MDFWKPNKTEGSVIRILPSTNAGGSMFQHAQGHCSTPCPICAMEKEIKQKAKQGNKMLKLKLEPSLIPESAWGQSLSNLHKKGRCKYWPSLRDEACMRHGEQCAFCDASPEHAHEVWKYDDANNVMTLDEVVPVCKWCHHCIHLGHAEVLASKGELDFKAVLQHFSTVRGVSRHEIECIAREAFDLWELRSRRQWTVDFGKFKIYIHEPGQLPPVEAFSNLPVTFDSERVPSKTRHVKWLSVKLHPGTLSDGEKTGHWLVSGKMEDIDKIWPVAARMTLDGYLGSEAYCNTIAQVETAGLLRNTGLVGIVLGPDDDKDQIEAALKRAFGKIAKSIVYKRPG
jgi:hypothetical protein